MECIHKIIINKNIEINLKIPKVLTAMEFEALMQKSKGIFKLSNIDYVPQEIKNVKTNLNRTNYHNWTTEEEAIVINNYNKKIDTHETAKQLGLIPTQIHQKAHILRKQGLITEKFDPFGSNKKLGRKPFVDREKVKELYNQGLNYVSISKKLNCTDKTVGIIVKKLRERGELI